MTRKQIEKAYHYILKFSHEYQISWRDEKCIDSINITQAAMEAFHECLDNFKSPFEIIIMDGNYFKDYKRHGIPIKHQCVPKADSSYLPVSCASILAKYSRDNYVFELCNIYYQLHFRYKLRDNVGYPTNDHKNGIQQYGKIF